MNVREDSARTGRRRGSAETIVDVAVVGGGIVGAAAALAAGQAGLSVVWVVGEHTEETGSSTSRDSRVYAISPSTQRFLERLRVWPQLDASRIAPVFDMHVQGDRDVRSSLHFDAYEAATERLATIVEHRELLRILVAAAAYFPGVERIEGLASQIVLDAEHVALSTTTGMRTARLVIAADGARSPTRTALGIGTRGKPYGQRALVGNFAASHPHGGSAYQWFTDEGVVALLPLAPSVDEPHAMSLVWSAPDAVADRLLDAGPDDVAARLSALCMTRTSTTIGPLRATGKLVSIPLAVQWADRVIAPRAVLVGDAAHVIHPLAGQGLNLGFGDVEALIDILVSREIFRDCGDRALLRRYERTRAEAGRCDAGDDRWPRAAVRFPPTRGRAVAESRHARARSGRSAEAGVDATGGGRRAIRLTPILAGLVSLDQLESPGFGVDVRDVSPSGGRLAEPIRAEPIERSRCASPRNHSCVVCPNATDARNSTQWSPHVLVFSSGPMVMDSCGRRHGRFIDRRDCVGSVDLRGARRVASRPRRVSRADQCGGCGLEEDAGRQDGRDARRPDQVADRQPVRSACR